MSQLSLTDALHLLYEPASSHHWKGIHSIKFDVEHLLWLHRDGSYTTDDGVRAALPGAGFISRQTNSPGHLPFVEFCVKPRFPMTWVWNDIKQRPKGARKAHWDAYQQARAPPVSPDAPKPEAS